MSDIKIPEHLEIAVSNNVTTIVSTPEYGLLTTAEYQEIIRRAEAYPDLEAERDMLNDLVTEKDQEIQELKDNP
jgi:hypothetical protein